MNDKHPSLSHQINYQEDFWKKFSDSIQESQQVLLYNIYRLKTFRGAYIDNLLHSKVFSSTLEYGVKNWSADLIEPSFSYEDLSMFANKGLEMSFYLQIAFFEVFDTNVDGMLRCFTDDLGRNKMQSQKFLADYEKLMTDTHFLGSKSPTRIKRTINIGEYEDEAENDDKYYLNFMKKYYED